MAQRPKSAFDAVVEALEEQGLTATAEQLADVLWLSARWKTEPKPTSELAQEKPKETELKDDSKAVDESPPKPEGGSQDPNKPSDSPSTPQSRVGDPTLEEAHRLFSGEQPAGGIPVSVAGTSTLPNSRNLSIALRPLSRRYPSKRNLIIDEEATANLIAEAKLWMPVHTSERTRWLDLALVIDDSSSMQPWASTLKAFSALLHHQGAFDEIQVWRLNTSDPKNPWLTDLSRKVRHNLRELCDPRGKRLVLFATDNVAGAWYDGSLQCFIKRLGQTQPVAILQMLPDWMWRGSSLGLGEMAFAWSKGRASPNSQLASKALSPLANNQTPEAAIPVFNLDPERIGGWAGMLAGMGSSEAGAYFLRTGSVPETRNVSSDERIDRFLRFASPETIRLAALLTATPLQLSLIRVVHRAMIPNPQVLHLAEFFVSGLIRPAPTRETDPDPENMLYEWHQGVSAKLEASVSKADRIEVFARVSQFLSDNVPGFGEKIRAFTLDPTVELEEGTTALERHFATVAHRLLRDVPPEYFPNPDREEEPEETPPPPPEPGQLLLTLKGHAASVWGCAWSPDGSKIVSGSWDDSLIVWDAETGKRLKTISGHRDDVWGVEWSPDGKYIASGSTDKTAIIWNAKSGRKHKTLTGHTGSVWHVAWSPDGRRIASASGDNTVKIWDPHTGDLLLTLAGHTSGVWSCSWSSDGSKIVSSGYDKAVHIWDAHSGSLLQKLEGHTENVYGCAWSPVDDRIASVSYQIRIWDIGKNDPPSVLQGHTDPAYFCAWSPDGSRLISSGYDNLLKLWDPETGQLIRDLKEHTSATTGCAWSPDGRRVVAASYDKDLMVWDVSAYLAESKQVPSWIVRVDLPQHRTTWGAVVATDQDSALVLAPAPPYESGEILVERKPAAVVEGSSNDDGLILLKIPNPSPRLEAPPIRWKAAYDERTSVPGPYGATRPRLIDFPLSKADAVPPDRKLGGTPWSQLATWEEEVEPEVEYGGPVVLADTGELWGFACFSIQGKPIVLPMERVLAFSTPNKPLVPADALKSEPTILCVTAKGHFDLPGMLSRVLDRRVNIEEADGDEADLIQRFQTSAVAILQGFAEDLAFMASSLLKLPAQPAIIYCWDPDGTLRENRLDFEDALAFSVPSIQAFIYADSVVERREASQSIILLGKTLSRLLDKQPAIESQAADWSSLPSTSELDLAGSVLSDCAWMPDGSALYLAAGERVVRIGADSKPQSFEVDSQRVRAIACSYHSIVIGTVGGRTLIYDRDLNRYRQVIDQRGPIQALDVYSDVTAFCSLKDGVSVLPSAFPRPFGEKVGSICLSFNQSGTLAAGYEDGSVWIAMSPQDQGTPRQISQELQPINAVVWNRDGTKLASACWTGLVRIFECPDLMSPAVEHYLEHEDDVVDVSFSHDGRILASLERVGMIRLWHTDTWKQVGTLRGFEGDYSSRLAFHPTEPILASFGGGTSRVNLHRVDIDVLLREPTVLNPLRPVTKRRALIVAMTQAPIGDQAFTYAGSDVEIVRNALLRRGYEVESVLDIPPERFQARLDEAISSCGEDDFFLLYAIGFCQRQGNRLLLHTLSPDRSSGDTGYDLLSLNRLLERRPNLRSLMVLDGGGDEFASSVAQMAFGRMRVICSGRREVEPLQHGWFSYLFSQALNLRRHDGEPFALRELGQLISFIVKGFDSSQDARYKRPTLYSTYDDIKGLPLGDVLYGTSSDKPLQGRTILWVDDHAKHQLADSLIKERATVVFANDTRKALDLYRNFEFDAVISDRLRGDNPDAGYDLLEALREQGPLPPFIIYTRSRVTLPGALARGAIGETTSFNETSRWLYDALQPSYRPNIRQAAHEIFTLSKRSLPPWMKRKGMTPTSLIEDFVRQWPLEVESGLLITRWLELSHDESQLRKIVDSWLLANRNKDEAFSVLLRQLREKNIERIREHLVSFLDTHTDTHEAVRLLDAWSQIPSERPFVGENIRHWVGPSTGMSRRLWQLWKKGSGGKESN